MTGERDTTPSLGGSASLGSRTVRRVGYGAMQLARLADDRAEAVRVVRRAIDLGVDHIDTALFYGDGFVNGVIADAVRDDDDVTIVTKIGATPSPDGPMPRSAQRPEELRASVEDNLRTLRLEQIPVVNMRRMDAFHDVPQDDDQLIDLDDQLAELTAMRDEGLVGGIGLSSTTAEIVRRGVPVGIAEVQNSYSLVNRADEATLELCIEHGVAWVPYFPLGGAFPGLPKVNDEPVVHEVASALGVTPSQVGLAWLLQHGPGTLLIPGTSSIEHLEANLAVGDIELDAATVARLDAIDAPG